MLHREGAVGLAYGWRFEGGPIESLGGPDGPLTMAWATAVELLVERLGGAGHGCLRVIVNGELDRFGTSSTFEITRSIELQAPTSDDVNSVVREMRRAAGDPLASEPVADA
jgi:hypothetical protein